MALNLFEKSDVRDTANIVNGIAINLVSSFDSSGGAGAQSETFYVVPNGRKCILYSAYKTRSNSCTTGAGLVVYNSSDEVLYKVSPTFTTNSDFFGGTQSVLEAGAYLRHEYIGDNTGSYCDYGVVGIEIDDRS